MWQQKKNRTVTLLGLGLVIITVAIYSPVVSYDFVAWDDGLHVYANPRLRPVTWEHLLSFWEGPYQHLYIPLTYTIWAALVWWSSFLLPPPALSASVFHYANLLLHLGNTLMVYRLGLQLGLKAGAAAVGAAVFLLHPLQVEPVVWVSGLKDVLCGWWSLLAIWAALASLHSSLRRARWGYYWLATIAWLLALLSKPAAVVVPLIVGILAVGGLGFTCRLVTRNWGWWMLVAVGWSIWTKAQQPDTWLTMVPTVGERLLIAADAVWFYLGKCLWPVRLGPDYGRTPHMVLTHADPWWLGGAILGCAALLWWGIKRCRTVALGGAVFGVSLLPVLGLVPFAFQAFSTVADRYSYMALIGVGISMGGVLQRVTRTWQMALVGCIIVGLLGVRSVQQVRVWQHTQSLLTYALQVNPRSILAHNNLGLTSAQQGDLPGAITHYQQALHTNPYVAEVHYNLANALSRQGHPGQALIHYRQAVQLKPYWAEAHNNLGSALDDVGEVAEAILHYQTAIRCDPELASAYNNLGDALLKQGRTIEAIAQFHIALRLQPTWAEAHYNLAIALTKKGETQEAIAAYRAALSVRPHWLQAALPLAWVLANLQPPSSAAASEAMSLAEHASRTLGSHQAVALYTLALAQRATGNTAAALTVAERALAQAIIMGDTALAAKITAEFPAAIQKG